MKKKKKMFINVVDKNGICRLSYPIGKGFSKKFIIHKGWKTKISFSDLEDSKNR